MHLWIQLFDTSIVACDCVLECRGRLRIVAGSAAAIIGWAFLIPVAVNVHAGQLAILPLYVNDSQVVEMVATVREG